MKVSQLHITEGETVHRFPVSPSGSPSRFPAFTVSSLQAGETFPGFQVFWVKAGKFLTLETLTGWKPLKETVRKVIISMQELKKPVKPFLTFPAFTVSQFHPFTLSAFTVSPFQPSPSGSPFTSLHRSPFTLRLTLTVSNEMIGKGNDQSSPSMRIFSDRRAEFLIVSISDYLRISSRPARFEISKSKPGKENQRRLAEKGQRKVTGLISSIRILSDRRAEISRLLTGGKIIDTFLYIGYYLVMGFFN